MTHRSRPLWSPLSPARLGLRAGLEVRPPASEALRGGLCHKKKACATPVVYAALPAPLRNPTIYPSYQSIAPSGQA